MVSTLDLMFFGLLGSIAILVFIYFNLYRFDLPPGPKLFQAILLLLIARMLDFTSFLLFAGDQVASDEANIVYIYLAQFLLSVNVVLLIQLSGFLYFGGVAFIFWEWRKKFGSQRLLFAFLATVTCLSLAGAFSNLIALFA